MDKPPWRVKGAVIHCFAMSAVILYQNEKKDSGIITKRMINHFDFIGDKKNIKTAFYERTNKRK